MAGIEFFQTLMGHKFFEKTLPDIADSLGALPKLAKGLVVLNATLEELLAELKLKRETSTTPPR